MPKGTWFSQLPYNEQYAHFCALGRPEQYDQRFQRGLADFKQLIAIDGVAEIGFNWEEGLLLIGTKQVDIADKAGVMHEVGQFIITISLKTPAYRIENITNALDRSDGSLPVAHPHAIQGEQMCMSNGNNRIKALFIDGRYAEAVAMIMTGILMRSGTVDTGFAYCKLEAWPVKGGNVT